MFEWLRRAGKTSVSPEQAGLVAEPGASTRDDDAVKWFRKAAEKGTVWGQFNLGIRYLRGDGLPQAYTEAMKWFQRAADQNDAMSQYWLGEMCERGLGVPADQVKAYQWYCLAASHGIPEAESARQRLQPSVTSAQIADG